MPEFQYCYYCFCNNNVYRAHIDSSFVTEAVTLSKYMLLLLLTSLFNMCFRIEIMLVQFSSGVSVECYYKVAVPHKCHSILTRISELILLQAPPYTRTCTRARKHM